MCDCQKDLCVQVLSLSLVFVSGALSRQNCNQTSVFSNFTGLFLFQFNELVTVGLVIFERKIKVREYIFNRKNDVHRFVERKILKICDAAK